jgi:deferrochelatase/peroxidase EfeB
MDNPQVPDPERLHPQRGSVGQNPGQMGAKRMSRRSLLHGSLMAGAGTIGSGLLRSPAADAVMDPSAAVLTEPFFGDHQGGILTGTQRSTVLAAFDLATDERTDLAALLQRWTAMGAQLSVGATAPIPAENLSGDHHASADSLEAYGLGPSRLTLTIGFGRSLFVDAEGRDRFKLAPRRPPALIDLPAFSGDALVAGDSDGDLLLQACADDAQVAFHAIRSLARVAPDIAILRWTQSGFSPGDQAGTPRNLMGFKDGTMDSNLHPPDDLEATLWAGTEGPVWMRGGSYLVYRRIRIDLQRWDQETVSEQEQVIGRYKVNGAPLGTPEEFSALDLDTQDAKGNLVIPLLAHVRLAAPSTNHGAVIVRRAFSYDNGTIPRGESRAASGGSALYDAGLLFLAYQKDPRKGFVPIFSKLAGIDSLNDFSLHTASGLFAVPPGARGPGDWVGRLLVD